MMLNRRGGKAASLSLLLHYFTYPVIVSRGYLMHKDDMNPLRKIYLVMFILLAAAAILIPGAAADEVIFDVTYQDPVFTEFITSPSTSTSTAKSSAMNIMFISESLSEMDEIYSITQCPARYIANYASLPQSQSAMVDFKALDGGAYVGNGEYGYFKYNVGTAEWLQIYTRFDDMDFSKIPTTAYAKSRAVQIYPQPGYSISFPAGKGEDDYTGIGRATTTLSPHKLCFARLYGGQPNMLHQDIKTLTVVKKSWQNRLVVTNETGHIYPYTGVEIIRNIDGISHTSKHVIEDAVNTNIKTSSVDEFVLIKTENWPISIGIQNPTTSKWFNTTISEPGEPGEEPEEPEEGVNKTFSVFIKDGNTYEPIDEANVSFKRYDTGEWLLNKTIYNGYASVTLPTGWYYVYVTSPGYYQPYPVQMVVDENLVSSIFRMYPAGESPEPEEPTEFLDLTISVKNSQTGALIGGSEIGIRRYGDTGFYQNLTLSSGYTTVFLPPANYEIFAEASGYYQVYPARITLDQPHENIGVFLQPITPIPEEGNVTLNLWVCYVEHGSGQAVGIPYADILISGISGDGIGYSSGSLMTDLGGYISIDIPANTEYIAYAEKPGYLAGTTHFTVYNVSPVNMTIQMIKEVPPTVPVVTPSPTLPTPPTPTTPPGFMERSGQAIGDLFGVSLDVGKMMLGGLICLAVGTATAKNLKGGAPEFCVGFLGAAFLTTMGGLIPVGFFVAMLLLMGIYIARAYLLGGENGG